MTITCGDVAVGGLQAASGAHMSGSLGPALLRRCGTVRDSRVVAACRSGRSGSSGRSQASTVAPAAGASSCPRRAFLELAAVCSAIVRDDRCARPIRSDA